MVIGMIGLGRMGSNMTYRLLQGGHDCVVFDRSAQSVSSATALGARGVASIEALVQSLPAPRVVWVMLPAGPATEDTVTVLGRVLDADDIVIDGGNTFYKDDVRRAAQLRTRGIHYLDVGTSGGVWGLERGYCLMVGGDAAVFARIEPILRTLAPGRGDIPKTPHRADRPSATEEGYLLCGPSGAGHFVKMIHNGIEYGIMQAYAEGFDILRNASSPALPDDCRYDLDLPEIAEVWRRGSVVGSWLLDLTAAALAEDPDLSGYLGVVPDSGEGRWTLQAAIDESVTADVLACALFARFRSRQGNTFADKVLSAMRRQFGGHAEGSPGG